MRQAIALPLAEGNSQREPDRWRNECLAPERAVGQYTIASTTSTGRNIENSHAGKIGFEMFYYLLRAHSYPTALAFSL